MKYQMKINNTPSIMKKIFMLVLLTASLQLVHAQDLKKVTTNFLLAKMDDAKTEIDKVAADPKQQGKPEVLYWKARVYGAIFKDPTLSAKYPNARQDAEAAYKAYMAADPAFAVVKEKGADGFFDMYSTAFNAGIKSFNDKKWDQAAKDFTLAVEFSDYIFKNKWSSGNQSFDTTSILYEGYAYQNGSKPADAAKCYMRLADGKVGGATYMDMYKFLANHFTVAKDEANFNKYLAIAKELYPKFEWEEFESEYIDQNLTLAEKTALYDKEDAAGSLTESKYLQFGDIFSNAHIKDKSMDSATEAKYSQKAADAFKKAFAKNSKNAVASYNVAVIYYNFYLMMDDKYAANLRAMRAINAEKPTEKDPKKKAAVEAQYKQKNEPYLQANATLEKPLLENLNISLEWLEKTYEILKDKSDRSTVEKAIINKTVDFLANLYAYKRDRARGKDLKAMDEYDAKFKVFDALHDKY